MTIDVPSTLYGPSFRPRKRDPFPGLGAYPSSANRTDGVSSRPVITARNSSP